MSKVIDQPEVADAGASSAVKANISASEAEFRRAEEIAKRYNPQVVTTAEQETSEEIDDGEELLETPETGIEGAEETEAEPSGEAEESKPGDDVLSQLNLDNLTPEQIKALGESLGSRAVTRFGELTARAKNAEEALAKANQETQREEDPLAKDTSDEYNPYSDVTTVAELQEKASDLDALIEHLEDLKDESDGLDWDETVATIGGEDLSRRDVRDRLREARKSRNKHLPNQLKQVQELEKAEGKARTLANRARQEFSWLSEEKSETRGVFQSLMKRKSVKDAIASNPMLAAELPYILAHAANNIKPAAGSTSTPARKAATKNAARRVESTGVTPSSNTAPSQNERDTGEKALRDLNQRFKKSGSIKDRLQLRTAQLTKQYS